MAKSISLWTNDRYKRAVKTLRRYFDGYTGKDGFDLRHNIFDFLSPYQRRKIRNNYDFLTEITAGVPKRPYRPRQDKKKKIKLVMESQGIKKVPKNLKVALVPDIAEELKVKSIKTKKITAKDSRTGKRVDLVKMAPIQTITMGVRRRYLFIDPNYLLLNSLDAISDAMELAKADLYTIQAGAHEIITGEYAIRRNDGPVEISKTIDKLIKRYGDEDANNYYRNWLGGLIAYYYPVRGVYSSFRSYEDRAKRINKERRKKERQYERKLLVEEIVEKKLRAKSKELLKRDRKRNRKVINQQIQELRQTIRELRKRTKLMPAELSILRKAERQLQKLIDLRGVIG